MSKATKKAECIAALIEVVRVAELDGDIEHAHQDADSALLDYIDDPQIRVAYENITRWYG